MKRIAVIAVWCALASSARADAIVPPECPHSVPREGDRCDPPAAAACVYHQEHGATACSCTSRRWHCAPLPPAPPSADS